MIYEGRTGTVTLSNDSRCYGLADWTQSAHVATMASHPAELRVEVKHRGKPPSPYYWEIYRGDEPMWIERAVDGYPTYGDAFEAGQTALVHLLGHEPLYKGN